MKFKYDDDQLLVRDTVSRLVRARRAAPSGGLRDVLGSADAYDVALWGALCEIGLPSAAVPVPLGGAGEVVALGLACHVLGSALALTPLVAASTAGRAMAGSAKHQLRLTQVLAGGHLTSIAVDRGERVTVGPHANSVAKLLGSLIVPFGHLASTVLILSRGRCFLVDAAVAQAKRVDTLDRGPFATIELDAAPADELATETEYGAVIATHDALLACELAGGARGALDCTLGYVNSRTAFGRPIGSFQALQHRLADLAARIDAAELMAVEACWVLAQDLDATAIAAQAVAYASDVFVDMSRDAIQMAGGFGYVEESDMQLFFRRAKTMQVLLDVDNVRWSTSRSAAKTSEAIL